jgi:hypothetical protein
MGMFENRVLRKIFFPKKKREREEWGNCKLPTGFCWKNLIIKEKKTWKTQS